MKSFFRSPLMPSAPFVLSFASLFSHLHGSGGTRPIMMCIAAMFVVILAAAIAMHRLIKARPPQSAVSRDQYDHVMKYIRSLELLRKEREVLLKRIFRSASSWPLDSRSAIDRLAEEFRDMKRDQSLMTRDFVARIGEEDAAGIIQIDRPSAVWEAAVAAHSERSDRDDLDELVADERAKKVQ